MTRPSYKLIITALLLLFPVCATARAQYHESPKQLAAEQTKADQDALTAWDHQCNDAFIAAHPSKALHLLTGPETGYYYKVGKAISAIVAEKTSRIDGTPLRIEPIATAQTACNLLGLEAKKTDFALVQSDIAHDAWFGHPPIRTAPAQEITLVAPLYVEAVHIVVRPHLNLARLSDLRGRKVWLGAENSLTVFTARRILDAAGLTSHDIAALDGHKETKSCPKSAICEMSSAEALAALKRLDLDAMFQVGAFPFDTLRDAIVPSDTDGQLLDVERNKKPCYAVRKARTNDPSLLDSEFHLFNLDVDLVERLVADGSYTEQLIPPDAYCQQSATLTVGVRALLLTNLGNSESVVRRIAHTLNDYQRDIETSLRQQIEVVQQMHRDPITGIPSRLSLLRVPTPTPLAVRYHPTITADKIYFDSTKGLLKNLSLLAGGLAVTFLVLYRFRRVVGPWLARRGALVAGLAAPIALWMVAAFVLNHYEGSVNEEFNTLPRSFLSTFEDLLTDMTFGTFGTFGNAPVTQTGQTALNWCSRIFATACGLLLVPTLIRSGLPKIWAIAKDWLLRLGRTPGSSAAATPAATPIAAPTTESPGAPDQSISSHPAPSH